MRQILPALRWYGLLICLTSVAPLNAHATPVTIGVALQVCANEACRDLSTFLVNADGDDQTDFDLALIVGGSEIHLFGTYDIDPFISFGATTTNLIPGPVTYAFLFGTPIVPGFYNTATSTGGVTVTNGVSGTATVANSAVYPTYISGYGTVGLVPTNLGVDLGTADCVATGTPFTITTTCNQGTALNTFAPTFFDNLEALLTYTQTDVASVAAWSGAVTLTNEPTAAPEPATLLLLITGAIGIVTQFGCRGVDRIGLTRRAADLRIKTVELALAHGEQIARRADGKRDGVELRSRAGRKVG
jgi:hypothetical protein